MDCLLDHLVPLGHEALGDVGRLVAHALQRNIALLTVTVLAGCSEVAPGGKSTLALGDDVVDGVAELTAVATDVAVSSKDHPLGNEGIRVNGNLLSGNISVQSDDEGITDERSEVRLRPLILSGEKFIALAIEDEIRCTQTLHCSNEGERRIHGDDRVPLYEILEATDCVAEG